YGRVQRGDDPIIYLVRTCPNLRTPAESFEERQAGEHEVASPVFLTMTIYVGSEIANPDLRRAIAFQRVVRMLSEVLPNDMGNPRRSFTQRSPARSDCGVYAIGFQDLFDFGVGQRRYVE